MRTFFALEIDNSTRNAIAIWRNKALPVLGHPVSPANFHITLNFLGDVKPAIIDQVINAANGIIPRHFDLTLNRAGYFTKVGVYWIAPSTIPRGLHDLVGRLRKTSRKIGINTDTRSYNPHLTLFRNCASKPSLPVEPVNFEIHCAEFTLFQSITGAKGVRYDVIQRWG